MIRSHRCHIESCRRAFYVLTKFLTPVLTIACMDGGGRPAFAATMTCQPSSAAASPGTSVTIDIFLENVSNMRGYQAAIRITRLSGSGELTVRCPDGVAVSQSRPDYIFAGLDTTTLTPGCANCGVIVTHCGQRRVAAARVSGGIDVGNQPAYLATFHLDVSADAAPGSTFSVEILPYSEQPVASRSIVGDSANNPIPFEPGAPCTVNVPSSGPIPTVSAWGIVVLTLLLLAAAKIYFGWRRAPGLRNGLGSSLVLLALLGPGDSAHGQICVDHADCDDGDVCSLDRCGPDECEYTPRRHGDIRGAVKCGPDGIVDELDILEIRDGFRSKSNIGCIDADRDIMSAGNVCEPDGIVDLFDIFGVLSAFAGRSKCPCETPVTDVEPPKRSEPACPSGCNARGEGDDSGPMGPVYLFSGEFHVSATDLSIRGRGIDFAWARKYRSKIGPNTAQGNGWDFSYNIGLEASGPDLILHNGNSRSDTYKLQSDGTWARREFFRSLEQNPDGSYTLRFSDTGVWEFHPLDGGPQAGKIAHIVDRNTNTISLDYDALGRLVTIHDPLDTPAHNRDITIAYNADGFIASVTDFAGRSVTYEYYDGVEPGGNFGDLKSVTTPAVVNTPDFPIPPGHEYPSGKTTVYTYSTGFADDRLNHNLLTITDPKGQTYLVNEYDPTTDPNDLNFDRIQRRTWGDPGDLIDLVYVPQIPTPDNNFATIMVIYNDRVGNVKEFFYDAPNRGVIVREYTGRADPDLPTTESTNRPTGKLRPDDPDFFENRYEHNADSLRTRVVRPNGNEKVFTYDSLNPSRRSQGNMLSRCRLPGLLGGDQAEICELYEYDDDFGGCCGTNFVRRHVDGRGNETIHDYDTRGNRIHTQHRIPAIVANFEYNGFGQMTARVLPDNGSNHRRRDEYTYYDTGPQTGYRHQEIVDATGFALTRTYAYNLIGDTIRVVDPRGHDSLYVVNQLHQTVHQISREVTDGSGIRYETDTFYDPNDNVVRVDVQNKDETGALQPNMHFTNIHEHEILNYRTRSCQEFGDFTGPIPGTQQVPLCLAQPNNDFISTEYVYDANRNQTLVRYGEAVNGNDSDNVVATEYDERDLTFRKIRAPGVSGPGGQSTTQYDYHGNRNRTRASQGIEDAAAPRITVNSYDGYDRVVTTTDPMGNAMTYNYDANHNRVSHRTDGELIDVIGPAGNVRLSEAARVYDPMDRLIRTEVEFFDTDTQADIVIPGVPVPGKSTSVTEWSDNSQVISVTNDNNHTATTIYDTANRVATVTDAKGNMVKYETPAGQPGYDANSNVTAITEVEKSDLGNLE